jgi:phosphoglycolate phosphatase
MLKAVIFDLDGTLADTMLDLQTAMNTMLRQRGWQERSREDLLRFINKGARAFVAQSMPDGSWKSLDDEEVTRSLEIYNQCYAACYADKTAPYPGVAELVKELSDEGMSLAVLSNKQDRFVKVIIEKLFPGIFAEAWGQSEYPTKPDPTAALEIARRLGVSAGECAFVGDSDIDMNTAKNAGMYAVGVSWGYRDGDVLRSAGADAVADDADALSAILKSKNQMKD